MASTYANHGPTYGDWGALYGTEVTIHGSGDTRDSSPWAHELEHHGQGALRFTLTLDGTGTVAQVDDFTFALRSQADVCADTDLPLPEMSGRALLQGHGQLSTDLNITARGLVPDTIEELEDLELLLGGPLYA